MIFLQRWWRTNENPVSPATPQDAREEGLLTARYQALIEQPLPEDLGAGLKLPEGVIWGNAIAMSGTDSF